MKQPFEKDSRPWVQLTTIGELIRWSLTRQLVKEESGCEDRVKWQEAQYEGGARLRIVASLSFYGTDVTPASLERPSFWVLEP